MKDIIFARGYMMKSKRGFALALAAFMAMLGLCACEKEVITVADMQEADEQNIDTQNSEYIEIREFELKEVKEEDGRVQLKHCAVVIPADYYASEEIPGMYLNERAPMESSNIYVTVSEDVSGIVTDTLTKQQYKEEIEKAYQEKGQEVTIDILSFEKTDMDGVPAYKIQSIYKIDNTEIEQLVYIVLAKKTYTITYSQAADDELMADFVVSDSEIKLVKKF